MPHFWWNQAAAASSRPGLLPQFHKASVFHEDALLSPPVYYSGGAGGIVWDIKITHILVKYLDCFPKPPVLE